MGRIDADSIGQRTASALERGLKDVVAVLARELNECLDDACCTLECRASGTKI